MKTNFLIILTLGGLLILIPSVYASEPQMIQIFQPDVEILPDDEIVYGESFTIRAWLESYDNRTDDLGFYVDVMDPSNNQVDSTLWFAREDFVYEFDTTHPAYNITESGTYQIKIEKAHFHERTGLFPKAITFEILFPEPEPEPTKEQIADSQIFCVGGFKPVGSECVPADSLTISYGHQWILKIILIVLVLIAILVGVFVGIKIWRKRK